MAELDQRVFCSLVNEVDSVQEHGDELLVICKLLLVEDHHTGKKEGLLSQCGTGMAGKIMLSRENVQREIT